MREIKFRGKKKNGEWVHGYLIVKTYTDSEYNVHESHLIQSGDTAYVVDPDTVGQYTGITDRNGKEIFEGDILRYTFDGVTKVNVIEFSPPIFTYRDSMRWSLDQDEVIGNIHEHPHLLLPKAAGTTESA